MATVCTPIDKNVDGLLDRDFDKDVEDAYQRLIASHRNNTTAKVVEAANKAWTVKYTCLNCLRSNSTTHPDNTTLRSLISFYSTRVCGSCGYIDQIKFPNGRSSLNYVFYGTVRIYDKYGSLVHTINDMGLKTAQDSIVLDTNKDNVYVSIWDNPKKIRTKRLIEHAASRYNSNNYHDEEDEEFDDDDFSVDDNSPVI